MVDLNQRCPNLGATPGHSDATGACTTPGAVALAIITRDLKQVSPVPYIKMDDGDVRGVFPNDGYIDGRHDSAEQIAKLIWERLQVTATLPVLAPRPAQSL